MDKSKYRRLEMWCGLNFTDEAAKVLNEDPNINIMFAEGILFWRAMSNNNAVMLKTLIEYYEKQQQSQYDSNSIEYKVARIKLQDTLKEHKIDLDLSNDILEILDKYIPQEWFGSEQDPNDINSVPDFDAEDYQLVMEKIRAENAELSEESEK